MIKTFEYELDGKKYNVEIVCKNNKNTYIRIKENLTIYVTTNYFTTKRDIKNLLNREKDFLRKTLNKVKKREEKEKDFYYLGNKYDIIIVPFDDINMESKKIYVSSYDKLNKYLKKKTREVFEERLKVCYDLFKENIPYPKLKVRTMKTRWGVNHKLDDSITLNAKLIRYDVRVIDYVIIHELSHFIHFDHSRAFWNTVKKYMPDYKKAVNVLKE
ncbi:MAG: DUF45 domain-containing protein [Bacilli bacterium]|nr:DUF45 domain-containing protein [Bacilli bacterium]